MNNPSSALPLPEIYFDYQRQKYLVADQRGRWIEFGRKDVERYLNKDGYAALRAANDNSEVDDCILEIQSKQSVEYASPLAGYAKGVYEISGQRILVSTSPRLIDPVTGEWPVLAAFLEGLLVDGDIDQRPYIFGWLKVGVESLRSGNPRPGQAVVVAGERNCGKSLLQNLITEMLGGRAAKPYQYMTDRTPFNADLFQSEHLMIEDEQASTDIRARRAFGNKIKQITSAKVQQCHGKHRQPLTLIPFWRISISVNNEPENLMVLPPLDPSIEDKLMLVKAVKREMPMPTATPEERDAFWNSMMLELPAFVAHLLAMAIPNELKDNRYGVVHFHHPELVEAIQVLSPEEQLLSMIDANCFTENVRSWVGTAEQLEKELTEDCAPCSREAIRLLSFPRACGTYLGRLKNRYGDRFSQGRDGNARCWTIQPPEDLTALAHETKGGVNRCLGRYADPPGGSRN